MNATPRPLSGIHHVRLPVSDMDAAFAFFRDLLGYQDNFPFSGPDGLVGKAIRHPAGGPNIVLWHDPDLAAAASAFPWFSIGMPDKDSIRELAAELDRRGIRHGGVQPAFVGVKLPHVQGPDGHLIGFYVAGSGEPASPGA
jgi:catechol 2,3-dioxygenase-like lactoylglutathione lyase family enzyme